MAEIIVNPGDDLNKCIRKFRKKVVKEGILKTYKHKRYYMKPSELRKIKKNNIEYQKKLKKKKRKKQKGL